MDVVGSCWILLVIVGVVGCWFRKGLSISYFIDKISMLRENLQHIQHPHPHPWQIAAQEYPP